MEVTIANVIGNGMAGQCHLIDTLSRSHAGYMSLGEVFLQP